MIIMQYGCGTQSESWHVSERRAPQYLRIYVIDNGEVTYTDAVTRHTLKRGCLYIFPAQRAYSLAHNPDDPIGCLWLHADVLPYIVTRLIEIAPDEYPDIDMLLSVFRHQVTCSEAPNACIDALGNALIGLMVQCGILSTKIDCPLIDTASIPASGSVKELSRRTGYSNEHFIRTFRRSAGITPYQYILSQRMNEAISLIAQGFSMDEIAARTGYSSGKSFSSAFKKRFGIPPDVYRRYFLQRA